MRRMTEHWYQDGLRFECTRCGNCCTGPSGHIWFTEEEGRAIAAHLRLDHAGFLASHAREVAGRWSLREKPPGDHGHDCIFLTRDASAGTAGCAIYPVRPTQCRTWPFWPALLASRWSWDRARHVTPCPGMDQGPLHFVPFPPPDQGP